MQKKNGETMVKTLKKIVFKKSFNKISATFKVVVNGFLAFGHISMD